MTTYVYVDSDAAPILRPDGSLDLLIRRGSKTRDAISAWPNGTPKWLELEETPDDHNANTERLLDEYTSTAVDGKLVRTRKKKSLTKAEKKRRTDRDPFKRITQLEVRVAHLEDVLGKALSALQQHEDPMRPLTIVETDFQDDI